MKQTAIRQMFGAEAHVIYEYYSLRQPHTGSIRIYVMYHLLVTFVTLFSFNILLEHGKTICLTRTGYVTTQSFSFGNLVNIASLTG